MRENLCFRFWYEVNKISFNLALGNLPTNCLSVFGHFEGLAFKGLNQGLAKLVLPSRKNNMPLQ